MKLLRALVESLRPHQWTKNVVLLAGLVFSEHLFKVEFLLRSLVGVAIFCGISSGVYLLNDLMDRDRDRLHPKKRLRPIPSGRFPLPLAAATSAILLVGGIALASSLSFKFGVVAGLYATLNIAYSLGLKNVVILDVMILASGFVLRAVAGVKILDSMDPTITLSPWLLVCTLFLALFLAIAKRRAELRTLAGGAASHRKSLSEYSLPMLDQMTGIVTACVVIAYSTYTISPDTVAKFGTSRLVYTVPIVLYGIFRYLYLMTQEDGGGNPSEHLVSDRPLLAAVLAYAAAVLVILYGAHMRAF